MHNSAEMLEAIWGILKAGAVVVPLNLSITDDAVAAMATDSAAVALVASGDQCARVEALRARLAGVRAGAFVGARGRRCRAGTTSPRGATRSRPIRRRRRLADDDECNIIYSSGTTGLPKGIVHTHRRRLDWAYDLALALRYHCGARTLCSLGLYSNISWAGFLCTLLAGGTVVIMRAFEPRALLEMVEPRAHHARRDGAAAVPAHPRVARLRPLRRRARCRSLMCCGSPLPPALKADTIRRLGCELIELYGLTEGLITTLAPEDVERKLASVGKPLPGTDLRILGADDQRGRARRVRRDRRPRPHRHGGLPRPAGGQRRGHLDRRAGAALAAHRRHRPSRRRRLPVHRRPQEGHDPVGRAEHLPGRHRARRCCSTPTWRRWP